LIMLMSCTVEIFKYLLNNIKQKTISRAMHTGLFDEKYCECETNLNKP
jgi:hypothetical protein